MRTKAVAAFSSLERGHHEQDTHWQVFTRPRTFRRSPDGTTDLPSTTSPAAERSYSYCRAPSDLDGRPVNRSSHVAGCAGAVKRKRPPGFSTDATRTLSSPRASAGSRNISPTAIAPSNVRPKNLGSSTASHAASAPGTAGGTQRPESATRPPPRRGSGNHQRRRERNAVPAAEVQDRRTLRKPPRPLEDRRDADTRPVAVSHELGRVGLVAVGEHLSRSGDHLVYWLGVRRRLARWRRAGGVQ